MDLPKPITRIEQWLKAIYEKIQGTAVTVEPLAVSQNGTITAPSGTAYSPITVEVERSSALTNTQSGTLAVPWGDSVPADRAASMISSVGDSVCAATLAIDASSLNMGSVIATAIMGEPGHSYLRFVAGDCLGSNDYRLAEVAYNDTGALIRGAIVQNGVYQDMSQYASMLPTTMTVYFYGSLD